MAEVNLRSWPEISQSAEGLQLNPTIAMMEQIMATMARLESKLDERERRLGATIPPPRPEPDPPDGPPLYAATTQPYQPYTPQPDFPNQPPSSHDYYPPPPPPYPYTYQPQPDLDPVFVPPANGPANHQPSHPAATAAFENHLCTIPEAFPQPRSPNWWPSSQPEYLNPQSGLITPDHYSPPARAYKQPAPNPNFGGYPPTPNHVQAHQPSCWDPPGQRQSWELTAYNLHQPQHQNQPRQLTCWDPPIPYQSFEYQPNDQPSTGVVRDLLMKLKSHWTDYKTRCNCDPPPPTHVETPANGFVEIQPLSSPPQHAQFQASAETITDAKDVETLIVDEVRTEELPLKDLIEEEDSSVEEGFDDLTEKILDSSRFCGLEKAEPFGQEYERKETQAQDEWVDSLKANASKKVLTDSWHVSDVACISHFTTMLAADARLIPPRTFLGIHGRGAKPLVLGLNYHCDKGPPLEIFDEDDERRHSTVRCVFDPGGNTSLKFLFAAFFVVSWFPP